MATPRRFTPGPHDLVMTLGDCELYGTCHCGKPLGSIRPNQSTDLLAQAWERHVMTEVPLAERPGSEF